MHAYDGSIVRWGCHYTSETRLWSRFKKNSKQSRVATSPAGSEPSFDVEKRRGSSEF